MPRLERSRRRRQRVPVGDLDTPIYLEDRVQTPPDHDDADASFEFSPAVDTITPKTWAKVETRSGKAVFDGVSQDRRITHVITFRKVSGITAETWIRLRDGQRLDIVEISDQDERGEFLVAQCDSRGFASKKAVGR
jgi:SPP1 family predicted phage head-tail adaptor